MNELERQGFTIIEGPFASDERDAVACAYDVFFSSLSQPQIKQGSTSARFTGLAALDPFYRIYLHKPLLELAKQRIGAPFKLSSFIGRTLRAGVDAPPLHQDVQPGADGDPLVGFILMVDAFTEDNGATRFLPGSGALACPPADAVEIQACGPAGSLLVFDGATWHEHGANRTDAPRRSVQGYFVRQDHAAAVRWSDQLSDRQAKKLPVEARLLLCL